MNKLPIYLQNLLLSINIPSSSYINVDNYLNIFTTLKTENQSLSYKALFELYKFVFSKYPDINQQKDLITKHKNMPPQYSEIPNKIRDYFMNEALKEAQKALAINEIPIGAIIVYNNEVIGRGHNQTIKNKNILHHAEIIAITEAAKNLNNHRLVDCDLYVTIEPCLMCSGAIINSRIRRVFFGATEPKTGAVCSQYNVFSNKQVNHHTQSIGPTDNEKNSALITEFFTKLKL